MKESLNRNSDSMSSSEDKKTNNELTLKDIEKLYQEINKDREEPSLVDIWYWGGWYKGEFFPGYFADSWFRKYLKGGD